MLGKQVRQKSMFYSCFGSWNIQAGPRTASGEVARATAGPEWGGKFGPMPEHYDVPVGLAKARRSEPKVRARGHFVEMTREASRTLAGGPSLILDAAEYFGWDAGDPSVQKGINNDAASTTNIPKYVWDVHKDLILSGTNSIITNPATADTDSDELWDGDEITGDVGVNKDTFINTMNYPSNPLITDSDIDGLSDQEELIGWSLLITDVTGLNIAIKLIYPNPLLSDADNDGLLDSEERYISDPFSEDTDGDGWKDGKNYRTKLKIKEIECKNSDESPGTDEFYLLVNNRRYGPGSERAWEGLDEGDKEYPNMIIDERVSTIASSCYTVEIKAYESDTDYLDFEWYDDLTDSDDYIGSWSLSYSSGLGEASNTFKYEDLLNTIEYRVVVDVEQEVFPDPSPSNALQDKDQDGIYECREYSMSTDTSLYGGNDKYKGLADPETKQIFVEVDWMYPNFDTLPR